MRGTGAGPVTEEPAPGNEHGRRRAFSLPIYLFVVFLFSWPRHGVISAYIRTQTRSLGIATVYHPAVDTARDSLLILVGSGPFNGIWSTLVIRIIGVILLVRGKCKIPGRIQIEWEHGLCRRTSSTLIPGTAPSTCLYNVKSNLE